MRQQSFRGNENVIKVIINVSNKSNSTPNTVKSQWLEHLWGHENLFETWVVQATENQSWCQVKKQTAIMDIFLIFYTIIVC